MGKMGIVVPQRTQRKKRICVFLFDKYLNYYLNFCWEARWNSGSPTAAPTKLESRTGGDEGRERPFLFGLTD